MTADRWIVNISWCWVCFISVWYHSFIIDLRVINVCIGDSSIILLLFKLNCFKPFKHKLFWLYSYKPFQNMNKLCETLVFSASIILVSVNIKLWWKLSRQSNDKGAVKLFFVQFKRVEGWEVEVRWWHLIGHVTSGKTLQEQYFEFKQFKPSSTNRAINHFWSIVQRLRTRV